MPKALEILINSINSQISEFNKENFKIYDSENPEFYLNAVYYDKELDKLFMNFGAERNAE